jgi:hypothetical protein
VTDLASEVGSDLPTVPPPSARRQESAEDAAARVFSISILISATRCVLTYVVFPWLLPLAGLRRGVGPVLGLVIALVAIGFNIASIRRFHRAGHQWRWVISALNAVVIVALLYAVVQDIGNIGH